MCIEEKSVTVICPTNRKNNLDYIVNNFVKQTYNNKNLIIVLNDNEIKLKEIQNKYQNESIKIIQIDEKENVSYCLNAAIKISKSDLIVRMDDDDIYGENYIRNSVKYHVASGGEISGIQKNYIYIYEYDFLGISSTNDMAGANLIFNREIFDKVQHKVDNWISGDDDSNFLEMCYKMGYKIFSRRNDDFIYMRTKKYNHTSQQNHSLLKALSKEVTPTKEQLKLIRESKEYFKF